jgi:hypothetical protein
VFTGNGTAGSGKTGNGVDSERLSRDIKDFLGRTDGQQNSWRRNGGQPPPPPRAASVSREEFDSSLRTSSVAPPSRNSIQFRASSVAPVFYGSNGGGGGVAAGRDSSKFSNGNGHWRELSPPNFSYRRNGDVDFSSRDVVSVTRSVTGRAAELPLLSAGLSSKAGQRSRFMTLEEECNWILSGREPLPVGSGDGDGADSDGEDDTLDDISGDEVIGLFFARSSSIPGRGRSEFSTKV